MFTQTLSLVSWIDWHWVKLILSIIVTCACIAGFMTLWIWCTDAVHDVIEPKFQWVVTPSKKKMLWYHIWEIEVGSQKPRTFIRSFKTDHAAWRFIRDLDPQRSAHDQVVTYINQATTQSRREFRHRQVQSNDNVTYIHGRQDTGSDHDRDLIIPEPPAPLRKP